MNWFRCIGGGSSPTPQVAEAYIYNVGQCAFNTGYTPKTTTKVIMKASPVLSNLNSIAYNNPYFFGTVPNSSIRFQFLPSSGTNYKPTFGRGDQYVSGSTPWNDSGSDFLWLNQPTIFTLDGNQISWYREVDPSTVNSLSITATLVDSITPLCLFACNTNSTAGGYTTTNYGYMILFYFEIYENNVLLHKYIPAYNNSQYCLYDTVDEVYIYDTVNSGNNVRGFIPS